MDVLKSNSKKMKAVLFIGLLVSGVYVFTNSSNKEFSDKISPEKHYSDQDCREIHKDIGFQALPSEDSCRETIAALLLKDLYKTPEFNEDLYVYLSDDAKDMYWHTASGIPLPRKLDWLSELYKLDRDNKKRHGEITEFDMQKLASSCGLEVNDLLCKIEFNISYNLVEDKEMGLVRHQVKSSVALQFEDMYVSKLVVTSLE